MAGVKVFNLRGVVCVEVFNLRGVVCVEVFNLRGVIYVEVFNLRGVICVEVVNMGVEVGNIGGATIIFRNEIFNRLFDNRGVIFFQLDRNLKSHVPRRFVNVEDKLRVARPKSTKAADILARVPEKFID